MQVLPFSCSCAEILISLQEYTHQNIPLGLNVVKTVQAVTVSGSVWEGQSDHLTMNNVHNINAKCVENDTDRKSVIIGPSRIISRLSPAVSKKKTPK